MKEKLGVGVQAYCDWIDSNIINIAYVGSVLVVILTLIINFI
ncbi:hypothetical protein [Vibrio kyushuensis]